MASMRGSSWSLDSHLYRTLRWYKEFGKGIVLANPITYNSFAFDFK